MQGNKETARFHRHAAVKCNGEEDDIIVSGQSCSYGSHAALTSPSLLSACD